MKSIEGALLFIFILVMSAGHFEMFVSGNGWKIDVKQTSDPWFVECIYYHDFHLFSFRSQKNYPCPLRLNESLSSGRTSFSDAFLNKKS
jgi:hypothetical protein